MRGREEAANNAAGQMSWMLSANFRKEVLHQQQGLP